MKTRTFDEILEWIKLDSAKITGRYSNKDMGVKGLNFIDIDNFLDVLYSLLESLNTYISIKENKAT